MSWPLQPIGPRPTDPIAPVDRASPAERRRERDPDDQQQKGRRQEDAPETPPGPDADGHIDVLA